MKFTQGICCDDKVCRRSIQHGATLIDVAIGAALLSLVLIPALGLMGQSSQLLQKLDVQDQLLFEAERIIEQTKIDLCDPIQFATRRGTFDAVVVGNETTSMRSRLTIEDSLAPSLLTMDALVWKDSNNNGEPDEGELSQQLRTQWSQL
ncbi:type IV pilus modification PilV family protein [Rhodopirellula bahusiensis]|uniref:Prepilin-type cleavage/methylation domain-containing protein n=1 Tax=Rhodopirellula bahusiensis TaxID=2014065 RepID=A0A2G1W9P6_9BACT|nr:hypothetical protein [Rhodopirellula bahusiensis]PHQ35764.1 hypothetical protein CEE69_09220 [Rhodopirellula bahusiensis]